MTTGIQLKVWGGYALFSRPEFKTERASYEVMTPSAARGILEAVHWKPAIRWVMDSIRVLKPIRFDTIRRNEVASKASYVNARQAAVAAKPCPISWPTRTASSAPPWCCAMWLMSSTPTSR